MILTGENVAQFFKDDNGTLDGEELIIRLIIDDGIASRGHRANIFKEDYVSGSIGVWDYQSTSLVGVFDYHTHYVPCYPEKVTPTGGQATV